ncbi:hypothetical protein L1987_00529 [Smallanthus sonchifolius]|uniref:Uncharacterized protein n=1 Tax=Smallanthus sonchifolius TaxID=185202 RepID=A0ACB9K2M6_9ASTR|nr:hypothetical protein L1987_00529 [Smallanthus sonchifolius]
MSFFRDKFLSSKWSRLEVFCVLADITPFQEKANLRNSLGAPGCIRDCLLSKLMFGLGSCSFETRSSIHQVVMFLYAYYLEVPK